MSLFRIKTQSTEQLVDAVFEITQCKGEKKIGRTPSDYFFTPRFMSESEFNDFFKDIVEVTMCLELDSSAFTHIEFPSLSRWYSCESGPALTIVNNPKLLSIDFKKDVKFIPSSDTSMSMAVVHANPKLVRESIDSIKTAIGRLPNEISDYGECLTPSEIDDLALLKCSGYYGDLVFGTNLRGDVPPSIGMVNGCLNISNTMLTDIEFLRDFRFVPRGNCQSEIRGNKYLCISEKLERHLRRQLNINIKDNMDLSCRRVTVRHVLILAFVGLSFGLFSLVAACVKLFSI